MAHKRSFFDAKFSAQWEKTYRALQAQEKKGTDKVIIALLSDDPTPGMRVKPIEPDKYLQRRPDVSMGIAGHIPNGERGNSCSKILSHMTT